MDGNLQDSGFPIYTTLISSRALKRDKEGWKNHD